MPVDPPTYEDFSLLGMVPIVSDGPCFCTPIFRNADGSQNFIQAFNERDIVVDFFGLGEFFGAGSYIPYRSNEYFSVAQEALFGFRDEDGNCIALRRREMKSLIQQIAYRYYRDYPFLFYEMAFFSEQQSFLDEAYLLPSVRRAIETKTVPVAFLAGNKEWSSSAVLLLEILWASGYGSGDIGRILGFSRNSVNSKVRRHKMARSVSDFSRNARTSYF